MRRPSVKAKAATAAPKQRVKGEVVPLEYTAKLMEHVGPTATAKHLGTTPGTLHKARNAGAISKVVEVAARGVWFELGLDGMERAAAQAAPRTTDMGQAVHAPAAEGVVLMLVQVPRGREDIVTKTVSAIGGTVQVQA